ncbi:hypothetical protein Pint_06647 [Pistacia integerrima]|uniref:Uncharacterized protein n=1 Tax=Pistacia integerrima TaxID=434235 RepID=A0ACC0Z3J7_9ROSI|nr:hypothetical protein Pint_06647 [Pistacia integerrima]
MHLCWRFRTRNCSGSILIAKDCYPDSLRSQLPKAVSSLEWAISEGKGKAYFSISILALYFKQVITALNSIRQLNTSYDTLTSKRPCGPNRNAIRGATYDLAKNDPWKESFESLPEYAFEDIADWERKLIQERVRSPRGT